MVTARLSTFRCSKDPNIQNFLKDRAIPFEKAHKSRTYIIATPGSFEPENINILAYFSVAIDRLFIQEDISKSFRRKLNGIFENDRVPCYLIGQMARGDACPKELLSGKELLEQALNILSHANDLVGGRFVRVDCKESDGLLAFYENNGFRLLPGGGEHGLFRLVRFISDI